MKTDLKHLYKAVTLGLSSSQKRLLIAICREPTAHLYARTYMLRHDLTRGGVGSALLRLRTLNLAVHEDGEWRLNPPELRLWLGAVLASGPEAAEQFRWATLAPGTNHWGLE